MAKKTALLAAERGRLARDLPLLQAIVEGLAADLECDASALVVRGDLEALARQASSTLENMAQLRAADREGRE